MDRSLGYKCIKAKKDKQFFPKLLIFLGAEGEIRTLERLLTVTRFPIVRARPGYATSP